MANCVYNIRTSLLPAPEGGLWTYIGYDDTSSVGTFTSPGGNLLGSISNNTVLTLLGDNFVINADGKAEGFYKFTYSLGGELIVHVIDDAICAGQDSSFTFSDSDNTVYNLIDFIGSPDCLSPTSGGTWTNVDGASGYSAGTFNPSLATPGTYRFEYSLEEAGFTPKECPACPDLKVTFTATVSAALLGSIDSSNSTQDFAIGVFNPVSAVANNVRIVVNSDSESVLAEYDIVINNSVYGDIVSNYHSRAFGYMGLWIYNGHPMQTGGTFRYLRVTNADGGGTIDIPLAPGGPYAATLSGVGGTTNATDLTFNSVAPTVFFNAIRIAIINYLGTLGFTNGTHYRLISANANTDVGYNPLTDIKILFSAKNNPTGDWLGLEKAVARLEYISSPGGPTQATTGSTVQFSTFSTAHQFVSSPCITGSNLLNISFNILDPQSVVNGTTLDYDTIPLLVANKNVTPSGNLLRTCNSKLLETTIFNCGGTLNYLWNTGDTTADIDIIPTGTYTNTVDCSSPVSQTTLQITI